MPRARFACIVVAGAAALATACASNTAPPGFLVTPVEAESAAYGGWIELTLIRDIQGKQPRGEGELLAAGADSVWVLTPQGGVVIPTAMVSEGKLTAYQGASAAGWTALGVVSTASNGLLLIITAPLWILTGTIAGASDSYIPQHRAPPRAWADLAAFARFPQGMPQGVSLETLKPKQAAVPERR
jgi:hypothetical protein